MRITTLLPLVATVASLAVKAQFLGGDVDELTFRGYDDAEEFTSRGYEDLEELGLRDFEGSEDFGARDFDDVEDYAVRGFDEEELALRDFVEAYEALQAREEVLSQISTRELIAEIADRLEARQDLAAAGPTDAAAAGASAPLGPEGSLGGSVKPKKHRKRKGGRGKRKGLRRGKGKGKGRKGGKGRKRRGGKLRKLKQGGGAGGAGGAAPTPAASEPAPTPAEAGGAPPAAADAAAQ